MSRLSSVVSVHGMCTANGSMHAVGLYRTIQNERVHGLHRPTRSITHHISFFLFASQSTMYVLGLVCCTARQLGWCFAAALHVFRVIHKRPPTPLSHQWHPSNAPNPSVAFQP